MIYKKMSFITVQDLIEKLSALDPERIVVMSRDGEGNSYSPLSDVDDSYVYIPETTWGGDIALGELTENFAELGYSEEDVCTDGEPAVVLWPTN